MKSTKVDDTPPSALDRYALPLGTREDCEQREEKAAFPRQLQRKRPYGAELRTIRFVSFAKPVKSIATVLRMRMQPMWWIALAGVAVLAGALWGPVASNVPQPKYEVIESEHDIEVRDYPSMIVAEVNVSGEREKAISDGFRILADYIFGNNLSSEKVAMTAPVTEQASEKIAMTAPVTQQGGSDSWQVRFIMPDSYTIDTLPKPKNSAVTLKQIEAKRFAVIRFTGFAGEESLRQQVDELTEYVRAKKLTVVSAPIYAFYNPPWTLPFLRRNEVMLEVAR